MKIKCLSTLIFFLTIVLPLSADSGNTINLKLVSKAQANKYNGLSFSIGFSVNDNRAANRANILYKHEDYLSSKPNIETNPEVKTFVSQSFIQYAQTMGLNISSSFSADYMIIISIKEFNVSYLSGIGWSGVANMSVAIHDSNNQEVCPKFEVGGRNKKNASGKDYSVASEVINKAFSMALDDMDWDRIVFAMTQRNNQHQMQGNSNQLIAQTTNINQTNYVVQETKVNQETISGRDEPKKDAIISDVDKNIPQSNITTDNTYVLIIANEKYELVDDVNFAMHDGETFKEYCIKTLGVPEEQVLFCPNATYGKIVGGVDWLKYALNNFAGSKGIVYYCGHGIPDEKSGEAYIVPVDGKGTNTTTCYSLNTLYKTLASTKAANITYFMDACFTGANKEGSMLVAARGVAREPAKATVGGNTVVFSASSGDETAMTYPEKGHGLFTYFLLKKLQETSGDVSYSELSDYINANVKKKAFLINEKPQTPVTATSPAAKESWRNMKLR